MKEHLLIFLFFFALVSVQGADICNPSIPPEQVVNCSDGTVFWSYPSKQASFSVADPGAVNGTNWVLKLKMNLPNEQYSISIYDSILRFFATGARGDDTFGTVQTQIDIAGRLAVIKLQGPETPILFGIPIEYSIIPVEDKKKLHIN
eukprot:TRINITY_DN2615_c0_g1_i1.p1 TRINITY_DN2615_c0_g1~~TRINITY_DN2615_c0_g1_i1.p1  ORF type:complete len:167 (+),score=47.38 TRINITY_DN2615_c0_g1_i1:61-501(+)